MDTRINLELTYRSNRAIDDRNCFKTVSYRRNYNAKLHFFVCLDDFVGSREATVTHILQNGGCKYFLRASPRGDDDGSG